MDGQTPWYKSQIIQQQVVLVITGLLGLLGVVTDIDWKEAVAVVFAAIGVLVPIGTILTRLFKPAPNLTATADAKEKELVIEGKLPAAQATSHVAAAAKKEMAKQQSGFVKISTLLGLVAVAWLTLTLSGCPASMNPLRAAENTEQKAYAAYGTVTIFAERGAALINDPAVDASLKKPVAQAIVAVKAPMDDTMKGLNAIAEIRAEVESAPTHDERLLVAATNLDRYYLTLEPLVGQLVKSVTTAVRCRKFVGQELAACQGGGS